MSAGEETQETRLDFRLLLPALAAWMLAAGFAYARHQTQFAVATGALTLAVILYTRRTQWRGVAALALVLIAVVLAAAGVDGLARQQGPVPSLAQERMAIEARAVVATGPRIIAGSQGRSDLVVVTLDLEEINVDGHWVPVAAPVVVFAEVGTGWEQLSWRSQVNVRGRLGPLREPSLDVIAQLTPLSTPVAAPQASAILRLADHSRTRLRQSVAPLPHDAQGLIPGLVIGDTSQTPVDLSEAMLVTGMSHLSAVSGSNVAIVLGSVILLCRWSGVPRRLRPLCAFVALVGFVILCRPEPSVMRASAMGVVGLAGLSSSRKGSSLSALGVAIVALLCFDPGLSRSYGFALSALATLGLIVFARSWADAIAKHLPQRLSWVGEAIAIPLAAQLMCAPVIVLLQGNVSTVAVLANLLAAPAVAPTTILGIIAAIGGAMWLPLGVGAAWLAAIPAVLIGYIARVCAEVPGGTMEWLDGPPGALLLALLTVLVILGWPRCVDTLRRLRGWVVLAALAGLVAFFWPSPSATVWPPQDWLVVGCDVGQGDAFVVRTGAQSAVLIDAGPDPDLAASCLASLGVDHLDAVVISHFHADHISGLAQVLNTYPVDRIYAPAGTNEGSDQEAWVIHTARAAGVEVERGQAGSAWQWGQAVAVAYWPVPQAVAQMGANDSSLVIGIEVDGVALLFLGDVEGPGARGAYGQLQGLEFDVLKVAHHGSADQSDALIDAIDADIAMIGVGAENSFGHPTSAALDLLHRSGARVLRTDTDGAIAVVLIDGQLATQSEAGG